MVAIGELKSLQVLILLLFGPAVAAYGQETVQVDKPIKKREPTKFIRVHYDEYGEPLALQTATVKYILKDDQGGVRAEVFLESVVHVGDAAYYRGFNRRFPNYDVVLYELVAGPDQRVPDPGKGAPHPARLLQKLVGDSLGLEFQIDRINYGAENMVHADLSPQEMVAARYQRGDDEIAMLVDVFLHLLRQASNQAQAEPVALLDPAILSDPDGGIELRRMMARTFDDPNSPALLPPTLIRNLIDDRNRRAVEVFQEQLDKGERRIAFFWGAAHMPDLEKRLVLEYGFQRETARWRNAWDLREGSFERAPLDSAIETAVRSIVDGALDEFFNIGNAVGESP